MHEIKPLYTMANRSGEIVPVEFFNWGDPTYGEVEIGVIDQRAIDAFTRGQCHALALALNKTQGWELYGLYPIGAYDNYPLDIDSGDLTPSHVIVRSDAGEYIDIMGVGADCRWTHRTELVPIQRKHVLRYEKIDYLEPNMDVAKKFVEPLLGLVQEQRRSNNYSCKPL